MSPTLINAKFGSVAAARDAFPGCPLLHHGVKISIGANGLPVFMTAKYDLLTRLWHVPGHDF